MALNKTFVLDGEFLLSQNVSRQVVHSIRHGVDIGTAKLDITRISTTAYTETIAVSKFLLVTCSNPTGLTITINGSVLTISSFFYVAGNLGSCVITYSGVNADIFVAAA